MIEDNCNQLAQWFDVVRHREPILTATERFVWLRVEGVPLHACDGDFFQYISSLFGNFITLDNSSYKKLKFDPGKVLIIVLVHGSVLVELYGWDINGSICGIKVTEEPCLEINACWVEKKKAVDSWAGRYNNPSSSDDYSSLKVESHKYTEKSQGGMFKEIRERM